MTGRPIRDRGIWDQDRSGGARRGLRPQPGARRWLVVASYGGLALLCLALGAVAFVLVAPPLDRVRDRLAEQIQSRTGRTLTVTGPMSVSLFPRVVVSLADATVLPPEGMQGSPTVTMPAVDAEMSLWSLLSRRPQVDRLTLHRPVIELAVDAQGRRNWAPGAPKTSVSPPPAVEARKDDPASRPSLAARDPTRARRRHPVSVQIVDGTLRYRDERSGTRHEIGALNLKVAAADSTGPVEIGGGFAWQGVPLRFSGSVSAELALDGRPGEVSFTLAGEPVAATYKGTLGVREGLSADGNLAVERLVYKSLKIGSSMLALSVGAGLAKATLQDSEIYGGRAQGAVTVDTTGPAPALAASLKLSGVSLLPLLGATADIGWLDGRGTVALDLAGQGSSERQIVETLQGKVQVAVADGAITGIDIDRSLRALQRGRLDRVAPRREDRTPFSELSGTFDIANGVARNQDLKLVSANLQLSGEGTIELAPRRIDYTLQTKIAGGQPDEGAGFQDRHDRAPDRHQRAAGSAGVYDQGSGRAHRRNQADRPEPALARGAGRHQGAPQRRRREPCEARRADREAA